MKAHFMLLTAFLITSLVGNAKTNKTPGKSFVFYAYHKAPYLYLKGETDVISGGIYQNLIDYLNAVQNEVVIELHFMPRPRLQNKLEKGEINGAIIGVNPRWFKDKDHKIYLWSDPFMEDRNIVILGKKVPRKYTKPEDLIGLRMALSRGLYYWGVSELIAENRIKVIETDSDRQNLEMLDLGRIDGTVTSYLTYNEVTKGMDTSNLQVQEILQDSFGRMILFPKKMQQQWNILAPYLKNILKDSKWLATLNTFGYRNPIEKK